VRRMTVSSISSNIAITLYVKTLGARAWGSVAA
jgi:hypothetical protein